MNNNNSYSSLPMDPFRPMPRRPFQRPHDDASSSTSSSSGSSDSSRERHSNSSNDSSSSSDSSSSVKILQDETAKTLHKSSTNTQEHPSKVIAAPISSTVQNHAPTGSNPRDSTTTPQQQEFVSTKKDDEFAHLDDFPWSDDDAFVVPSEPNDIPETVVVPLTNKSVPNEDSIVHRALLAPTNHEDAPHPLLDETSSSNQQQQQSISESDTVTLGFSNPLADRRLEIDPCYFAPEPFHKRPPPVVHHLTSHNRPQRTCLPVTELFANPIHLLWKHKFAKFNHLQSEVANALVRTNDTIVVSAPTGAGKTAVFEMAMARHLQHDIQQLRQSTNDWHQQQLPMYRKMVYLAPSKALCEERYEDWSKRLAELKLGIRVAMITGDAEPRDSYRDIATSHLIVSTPEKWDSLTRRWSENYTLFASVKLVLIDEVHQIGDPSRGACLETVLCRMKTIHRASQNYTMTEDQIKTSNYANTTPTALASFLRFVAVSATLPNIADFAAFLGANEAFAFDASYRPVPLSIHVVSCGEMIPQKEFMFNKKINYQVPNVIKQFSKGKPTIVFCHTKKETEELARQLSAVQGICLPQDNPQLAGQTSVRALQACLLRGVAYHNAGLDAADRKLVEQAFLQGQIRCLCATSTLATGVNTPAHCVVVKGTVAWRGSEGGYQEIDKGTLLQMIGRAGRPGYDPSGTAVIMTDHRSEYKYKTIGSSLEVVESHLLPKLVQALNTEIAQGVVNTFQSAKDWLATTFMFQRLKGNPRAYQAEEPLNPEQWLIRTVGVALKKLHSASIVVVPEAQKGAMKPTFAAHVMNQHMVDFESMKLIMDLPFDANTRQILEMLSQFEGMHKPVRRPEKKILVECHKSMRYQFDGPQSKIRIQEPHQKAFVLIQAAISAQFLDDYTLRQEMSQMVEMATRMLVAMEEYYVHGPKNGMAALQSHRLRRSLAVSLWGSGDGVLNQLKGVGHEGTAKLRFGNIISFQDVLKATEEDIDKITGRRIGRELRRAVSRILQNRLTLSVRIDRSDITEDNRDGSWIVCSLARKNVQDDPACQEEKAVPVKYTMIAFSDRPHGALFFRTNVDEPGEFRFKCPDEYGRISVHLVSSMVGLDEEAILEGRHKLPLSSLNSVKKRAKGHMETPVNKENNDMSNNRKRKSIRDPHNRFKRQTVAALLTQSEDSKKKMVPDMVTPSPVPLSFSQAPQYDEAQRMEQSIVQKLIQRRRSPEQMENPAKTRGDSLASRTLSTVTVRREQPWQNHAQLALDSHQVRRASMHNSTLQAGKAYIVKSSSPEGNWRQQKREQRTLQKSAFRKEGENPFSRFSYDPNDAESNLARTIENAAEKENEGNILPPDAFASVRQDRPRIAFKKEPTRLRGVPRGKRGACTQSVSSHTLLRMKKDEYVRVMPDRHHLSARPGEQDYGYGYMPQDDYYFQEGSAAGIPMRELQPPTYQSQELVPQYEEYRQYLRQSSRTAIPTRLSTVQSVEQIFTPVDGFRPSGLGASKMPSQSRNNNWTQYEQEGRRSLHTQNVHSIDNEWGQKLNQGVEGGPVDFDGIQTVDREYALMEEAFF